MAVTQWSLQNSGIAPTLIKLAWRPVQDDQAESCEWTLWVRSSSLMSWGRMDPLLSPHSSLTAITTSDVISYSRGGGWDSNWNSDDSFLYSENVAWAILLTVPCPVCLNSIYSVITFGKLIKTLVWPGPGLLVSVNRDASGDMMIENALGYFDVDPGYQYSREVGWGVSLSALTTGSAHIRGSRSFSRFPPLFPHNEPGPPSHTGLRWVNTPRLRDGWCGLSADAPLYSRASCHAPVSPASHDEPPGTDIMAPWHARDVLKSAVCDNECLRTSESPLTSLSPRFLPASLSGYQILKPGNIWRPPAHYPCITTKHFFLLLQFFYTGIERFLFVWLALHWHITEKRAADWSRGGSPLSNHCHKAELPGSRVSSQNSHNIIQLGVKTPAPGTMAIGACTDHSLACEPQHMTNLECHTQHKDWQKRT